MVGYSSASRWAAGRRRSSAAGSSAAAAVMMIPAATAAAAMASSRAGSCPANQAAAAEPEPGAGQRAGDADDRALGDHQPGQRGVPPAEAADGGQLGRAFRDVQEHHVGDGQHPECDRRPGRDVVDAPDLHRDGVAEQ